jgi:hypothetical protein
MGNVQLGRPPREDCDLVSANDRVLDRHVAAAIDEDADAGHHVRDPRHVAIQAALRR